MSENEAKPKQFKCEQCGASVDFVPGTTALVCPYCQHCTPIARAEGDVEELDLLAYLGKSADEQEQVETKVMRCRSCGAATSVDAHISADSCAFCGSDLITKGGSERQIRPRSLLPFRVTSDEARALFEKWIAGRWFAPNRLRKLARVEGRLRGVYVPYWTYDAGTSSKYVGERGEDYWVTESYTTIENGKTVTRTRQVRKTRWYPARGTVRVHFDDVLILASRSLPQAEAVQLAPWDLENLEPFQEAFLSGFSAETYQVSLEDGFRAAQSVMSEGIRDEIRRDIGGDHQRIHSVDTQWFDLSFKHILLPVWVAAYRYAKEVYRFLVNGRTGEVQGERPWSWVKIAFAVLAAAAVAVGVYFLAS